MCNNCNISTQLEDFPILLFILFYDLINFSENENPHHSESLFAEVNYSLKSYGT